LSRDTKLFERTAPSTYCVRSPFRKDPADADAILSAAREKIQVFQNGLSDSEEAEKDADDAERDDDSECEAADDLEVDDTSAEAKLNTNILTSKELTDSRALDSLENENCEIGEVGLTPQSNAGKSSSARLSGSSNLTSLLDAPQSIGISPNWQATINADAEDTEIDENNSGEPWVQGLIEGDYSDLTVEERLNALVALIGVAIEGNSIRVILEVGNIVVHFSCFSFSHFLYDIHLILGLAGTSGSSKCSEETNVGGSTTG